MESLDTVDSALLVKSDDSKRINTIEPLNSEMLNRCYQKDRGRRALRTFLNRLRLRKTASADITEPDPTYKVAYLGNVITGWAKGEGCVEKPLATLWRNYTQSSRSDVRMHLTVSSGGLRATTKDHGLTEYWANRLTYCAAPLHFSRLFCWVYRHEGRRLRHELRCHAVLCSSSHVARQIESKLKHSLALALTEFKRDKISRQNARLSLVNSVYENPTIPRRKILLSTGSQNYRPPLERSKSAPKLTIIEENLEENEEIFEGRPRNLKKIFRHYDSTGALLDKKKMLKNKLDSCKIIESCDNLSEKKEVFLTADEKSEMILQELIEDSFRNDLIESCSINGWLQGLSETPDLIPMDSDESSLSSGCESASTITSDLDQQPFSTILEEESPVEEEIRSQSQEAKKAELDFKLGGTVLNPLKSLEKLGNSDLHRYCGLRSSVNANILQNNEVSLIPVGENKADFSSLKVFKKKAVQGGQQGKEITKYSNEEVENDSEEENGSACSDESGYDEIIDCTKSVKNIILV